MRSACIYVCVCVFDCIYTSGLLSPNDIVGHIFPFEGVLARFAYQPEVALWHLRGEPQQRNWLVGVYVGSYLFC